MTGIQQVTTQIPRDLEPMIPPRDQPSATEIPQTVQAEPQLQNGPQQSARSPNPWEKRAVTLKRGVAGPFVGVLGIQFAVVSKFQLVFHCAYKTFHILYCTLHNSI